MDPLEKKLAKTAKILFVASATSQILAQIVGVPFLHFVLVLYACLGLGSGFPLATVAIAMRLAHRRANKLLGQSTYAALPSHGLSFPEWQEQHFRRFGPPK